MIIKFYFHILIQIIFQTIDAFYTVLTARFWRNCLASFRWPAILFTSLVLSASFKTLFQKSVTCSKAKNIKCPDIWGKLLLKHIVCLLNKDTLFPLHQCTSISLDIDENMSAYLLVWACTISSGLMYNFSNTKPIPSRCTCSCLAFIMLTHYSL